MRKISIRSPMSMLLSCRAVAAVLRIVQRVIREALRECEQSESSATLDERLATGQCDASLSMADITREARRRLSGN
jgi:hypothetical protein